MMGRFPTTINGRRNNRGFADVSPRQYLITFLTLVQLEYWYMGLFIERISRVVGWRSLAGNRDKVVLS